MQRRRRVGLPAVISLLVAALVATPALAVSLVVTDLTGEQSPTDLAEQLAGSGVTVSNVTFTGDDRAAGSFTGGAGVIGFEAGILLSSGRVVDVVGPNDSPSTSTSFGLPGDAALTQLGGVPTFDAAILEFDFVPQGERLTFTYVFGSEEYNEFVTPPLTGVNDTFAFFVNGVNCSTVPNPNDPTTPYPVSITTVNNGQPGVPPVNPDLYVNNDPFSQDSTGTTVPTEQLRDTQMDGFTVVLTCKADVNPGEVNRLRLAIADGGDAIYDSWVLLQAGSLTAEPDPETGTVDVAKVWIDADATTVTSTPPADLAWSVQIGVGEATYELTPQAPSVSFPAEVGAAITLTESTVVGYERVTGSTTVGEQTLVCADEEETAAFEDGAPQELLVCNQALPDEPPPPNGESCPGPAAPAWAAQILKTNDLSPMFRAAPGPGKGKPGINLVAAVAQKMGSGPGEAGTDFAGVPKDQRDAYGAAVRDHLEELTGRQLDLPMDWPSASCEAYDED
jgi:hypothetical protein